MRVGVSVRVRNNELIMVMVNNYINRYGIYKLSVCTEGIEEWECKREIMA